MKTLSKIIQDVADALSLPLLTLSGQGVEDWNEQLDEWGGNGILAVYDIAQRGTLEVTSSRYGYLSYDCTILFCTMPADETDQAMLDSISDCQQRAYEFFSVLSSLDEWKRHQENGPNSLLVNFQEAADIFDTEMCGVYATTQIKIDPSFDRTPVCDSL